MANRSFDIVIVGAGIMGLSLAHVFRRHYPDLTMAVIERENRPGLHTSGRNSGVLHQGIYYRPQSFKARFCVEGARRMTDYVKERGLSYQRWGKVIVPTSEEEDRRLDALYNDATQNGAEIVMLDREGLKEIEPRAFSPSGRALYSPRTSVINPLEILESLRCELANQGVQFFWNAEARMSAHRLVLSKDGALSYGFLVNAAGLHADRMAHSFGCGKDYTLLPFKGLYWDLDDQDFRCLVYPVPDVTIPFLGLHVTKSISGQITLGPTALPALGREHYRGLEGFSWRELFKGARLHVEQYMRNSSGYRSYAHREIGHLFKGMVIGELRRMVPSLRASGMKMSQKVGIRAQLFHLRQRRLEMDFVVERGPRSLHILNAVSPGFTSALSFADWIVSAHFDTPIGFRTLESRA